MNAIQELLRDHEAIAGMLARLEREIDDAERTSEIDRARIEPLLEFFERKVDGHHQEKEERAFLPCLMRRVSGEDSEHVQKLFREHREDRSLLAMMRSNLAGAAHGEPNCVQVLVRYGRLYLLHERRHAAWEEDVLFSVARRVLTPKDDQEILQAFRRLDAQWGSPVTEAALRLASGLDRPGAVSGARPTST